MTTKKRQIRVFLCHSSADKLAVRELYERIKNEAWIDPWLDVVKILPGQHWSSAIKQSLDEADSVIIFISNNSINREGFIQKEMNYAWDLSLEKPRSVIYLIPIRLEECEVPYDLKERQWADYFGENKEETYNALLKSLKIRREQRLKIEEEEYEKQKKEKQMRKATEKAALSKEIHKNSRKNTGAKVKPKVFIRDDFEYLKARKTVYIFDTGRGIITSRHWLKVLNADKFLRYKIEHTFTPSNIRTNQQELPDMSSLIKGGIHLSAPKPFFAFRIIEAKFEDADVKIHPLNILPFESHSSRRFLIEFPYTVQNNDQIIYEWAWGMNDLYIVNRKKFIQSKLDYESSYFEINFGHVEQLEYNLYFQRNIKLVSEPQVYVTASQGGKILYPVYKEVEKDVLWNKTAISVDCSYLKTGKVEFRWIPE